MPESNVRLLTMDLDDTLWPCAPVIRAAEEAVHQWLQQHAPALAASWDIASMRDHRLQLMAAQPEIAHDLGLVRLRSVAILLEESGYPPQLSEDALELFLAYRNRVHPYAEVVPALQRLAGRYELISVTNGNAEVAATPLRGLFAHDLSAAGAGAAKPDPAMFAQALELAGCSPAEAVHLGDDPVRDVEAARAFGMTAVWINRDGRDWPEELEPPDFTATDLEQVITWLAPDLEGDFDGV